MSTTERPAADQVTDDFANFISDRVGNAIGSWELRGYEWAGEEDDDDPYPPLIVADSQGRRFEVEFEVMVTELSDEEMARRAALLASFKAHQATQPAGGTS